MYFPTPADLGNGNFDTGIGIHLSDGNNGYSEDSIRMAASLGVRHALVINLGDEVGDAISQTFQLCLKNGVLPVSRVYLDMHPWTRLTPDQCGAHTSNIRKSFALAGHGDLAPYVQIGNEPNLAGEWGDNGINPVAWADHWLPCAQAVLNAGGIPIYTPLSPGGNYNDWAFFVRSMKRTFETAGKDFFTRIVLGVHNYTGNKWLDWGSGSYKRWDKHNPFKADWDANFFAPGYEDDEGFMMYQWYHDFVYDLAGVSVRVRSCEGGTAIDANDLQYKDDGQGKVTEAILASYITSQNALMMGDQVTDPECVRTPMQGIPDWYQCTAYWTWGAQGGWTKSDLRTFPGVIARMQQQKIHPRTTSPIVVPAPDPVPAQLHALHGAYKPGHGLVQGNVPVGAQVAVDDHMGNIYRTAGGKKTDFGPGGFEVNIYGNPPSVQVSVDGCAPLEVSMQQGIPFITIAQEVPVPQPQPKPTPPPQPKYTFVEGFAKYVAANPTLHITANGVLEYTGENGDGIQRILVNGKRGFLLWDKGNGGITHVVTGG